ERRGRRRGRRAAGRSPRWFRRAAGADVDAPVLLLDARDLGALVVDQRRVADGQDARAAIAARGRELERDERDLAGRDRAAARQEEAGDVLEHAVLVRVLDRRVLVAAGAVVRVAEREDRGPGGVRVAQREVRDVDDPLVEVERHLRARRRNRGGG